ncbi:hypothetical protein [uncultured Bacteroides sp.]|uniref:hypothetical protein n=1 Tax=uncultured Bacteroides sp. TaxID=162156 RepID=UPI002AABAF46|nr:hypothetical protein [uncultured Bacteroides sp.]
MRKKVLLLILLLTNTVLFAQQREAQQLLEEGKCLYHLEKASWYASDLFLADYPQLKDSLNGYLSYQTDNNNVKTIFYSLKGTTKILARYEFASISYKIPISVDINHSQPTNQEKELIALRTEARHLIETNPDHFFSFYKNTSLNIIPVITPTERKVYLITAPQIAGVVLIGNDYLLTFNNNNELIKKVKLHNSLIDLPCKEVNNGKEVVSTIHSHVVSEYITPTDICTLLLYKDFIEWTEHIVMGRKYVSVLNLKDETLTITPKETWEKANSLKTTD